MNSAAAAAIFSGRRASCRSARGRTSSRLAVPCSRHPLWTPIGHVGQVLTPSRQGGQQEDRMGADVSLSAPVTQ